jgi:hypothetical protein
LKNGKSVVPSAAGTTISPSMTRAGADVPGIVGNLSETPGPIVAPASENLDGFVYQVNLDAVAVELDFMNPPLARWYIVNRRCQRGFYESG